ncbi:MAG: S8 family serine peptidase [Clostridiales bacterium]|nr:S8 family serine peptidase [Clostridiales bacterium]
MKKKYMCLIIIIVFILTLCFGTQSIAFAQVSDEEEKVYCKIDEDTDFADDTIMVVLTNKVSLSTKKYTVEDFSEIDCVEVEDLTEELWEKVINHEHSVDCDPERETKAETFNRILMLKIPALGKFNVIDSIRKLEQRNDVKGANPDYFVSIDANSDDTNYESRQWGLDKIGLHDAWNINTGNSNVVVGVIDTGVDGSHPDLKNRVNTTLSYDFTSETDDPFRDNVSHGTHVAGIIGAEGNNNMGVIGVCWDVSIVSLKISNTSFGIFTPKVILALQHATVNNIPIVNISLQLNNDLGLAEAIENYPGLIVCCAGNSNKDIDQYDIFPAAYSYDNILSIGASTSFDTKASFSNYGATNVDIFAPGEFIYSTVPLNYGNETGYGYKSGTSMATPFVAGVAALLLSHNDTLTTRQLKNAILNNYDVVDEFSDYCVTGGRLNAFKALNNSHKYKYNYNNSSYHTKYCDCGYSENLFHTYDNNSTYSWINYTHHWAYCSECGGRTQKPHAVSSDSFGAGEKFATCLFCGGRASRGVVKIESISEIQLVTENGSFVLPNGVVVLVDEDIGAYLNGTLVFYSSNSK